MSVATYCLPPLQCGSEGQNLWLLTFQSMGYASEPFCSEFYHLRVLQRPMEHTSGLILVSEAHKPGTYSFYRGIKLRLINPHGRGLQASGKSPKEY